MNTLTLDYQALVQNRDNEVTTTSKIVSDTFGKLHKDVLRKIDAIIAETPVVFNERNFTPIEINVKVGFGLRAERAYELTKDGFMLLVMGFTGKKAMTLKIEFINAFNWMYDQLQCTDAKQRECLISACDKLAVGNTLRSDVYTQVANHFGYDKPSQIPTPLLPEAVAYVYELMLVRQGNPNFNLEYLHKMFGMGTKKVDEINHAIKVAEKHLTTLEYSLKALDTSLAVIKNSNSTNFSVFESLRWQAPAIEK